MKPWEDFSSLELQADLFMLLTGQSKEDDGPEGSAGQAWKAQ